MQNNTKKETIIEFIDEYKENQNQSLYLKSFAKSLLLHFDQLLSFIYKEKSELFIQYLRNLGETLSSIIASEKDVVSAIKDIIRNVKLVEDDSNLLILRHYKLIQFKIIEVMKIALRLHKVDLKAIKNRVVVTTVDKERGRIIPLYLLAKSLEGVLPKEEALRFYQRFIESSYQEEKALNPNLNMVEEMLEFFKETNANVKIFTSFKLNEGQVGAKVMKCMLHETLKSFSPSYDRDFAYLAICYPDFFITQRMNNNFILTRTKTLLQGNEFCDFCWHDKRINKEIHHPDEEFWKNL
ncbi:MAG: L-2-amino-thiazoline-4-carboxylic acid hydrolase [Candidatus Heimdallarchaeaceae archaeon]